MPDLFFYRDPEDEEEEEERAAEAQMIGYFETGKEDCTTGKGELEDLKYFLSTPI